MAITMNTQFKMSEATLLDVAYRFTKTHRAAMEIAPARRELDCLRTLYPAILMGPEKGDLLAGRLIRPLAGFSNVYYPEKDGMDVSGYYFDGFRAQRILDECGETQTFTQEILNELNDYWGQNNSFTKTVAAMDEPMHTVVGSNLYIQDSAICHRLHRIASPSLDFAPLLKLGVRGYQKRLSDRLEGLPETDADGVAFLESACGYLDLFVDILKSYAHAYEQFASEANTTKRSDELNRVVYTMQILCTRAPETFFEAVQLVHLYTVTGFVANAFGRLDDDLGPYLVSDLESGRISKQEATSLLVNYWQLMAEHYVNSRMTLGGLGRRNPAQADVFCEIALEATRIFYTEGTYRQDRAKALCLVPQVAFRLSQETPAHLRKLAMDVIASGATFPILYNDDANVPAVAHAFEISAEDAAQYTFFDCGEYIIHGKSIGTPSTIINMPKALEVALHNGIDPRSGKRIGPENPDPLLRNYDAVWNAYARQIEYSITECARFQKLQFNVLNQEGSFLAMSLMMNRCVERARGMLDGGCEMLGGTLESYGNITVADSLYAIKRAVFEERRVSLRDLIAHQDTDFIQDETLCESLLTYPKFGNDIDEVDAFAQQVNSHVCAFARAQAERVGLHHFLIVVINNGANVTVGHHVNATADGRRTGLPVSNGHTPSAGRDTSGITALLNSILKLSPDYHAGAVHNLRFSRQTITEHREKVDSMLNAYFARGGTQCMITMTSREELEDALNHPEAYGHLLVRVGGYSARFIDLPQDIQMEIVNRNAY